MRRLLLCSLSLASLLMVRAEGQSAWLRGGPLPLPVRRPSFVSKGSSEIGWETTRRGLEEGARGWQQGCWWQSAKAVLSSDPPCLLFQSPSPLSPSFLPPLHPGRDDERGRGWQCCWWPWLFHTGQKVKPLGEVGWQVGCGGGRGAGGHGAAAQPLLHADLPQLHGSHPGWNMISLRSGWRGRPADNKGPAPTTSAQSTPTWLGAPPGHVNRSWQVCGAWSPG